MFGFLKKKLKKSVDALAERTQPVHAESAAQQKEEAGSGVTEERRKGLFGKIKHKEFSEKDIDEFLSSVEIELMQANLALEVIDYLREGLKKELVGKPVSRKESKAVVRKAFGKLILSIVDIKYRSIDELAEEKKPLTVLFLGFNGSGKTTTIAKIADRLQKSGKSVVFAAADTFRAASIEQLEVHGKRLGIRVIKHRYGADPAAVVFDARKHAQSKGIDVVLADSAGRMHTNANLMDELKKIVRVNSPDLKILVVDSLTGNDVVSQARSFSEEVGIDGMVLTKMDVNEKGGSLISACHATGKPVMFMGTGQEYSDLEPFEPQKFVEILLKE